MTPNGTSHGPPITVLICHCDDGPLLARALQSLCNQSKPPAEVIIVDDGSKIQPDPIVIGYADRLNIRLLHHDRNRGTYMARRTGINAVTTPYFCCLDSDDVLLPHALDVFARQIERQDCEILIARNFRYAQEAGPAVAPAMSLTGQIVIERTFDPKGGLPARQSMNMAAKLFRTPLMQEVVARLGPIENLRNGEDTVIMHLAYALAQTCRTLAVTVYGYTIRDGSLTAVDQADKINAYHDDVTKGLRRLAEVLKDDFPISASALAHVYTGHATTLNMMVARFAGALSEGDDIVQSNLQGLSHDVLMTLGPALAADAHQRDAMRRVRILRRKLRQTS